MNAHPRRVLLACTVTLLVFALSAAARGADTWAYVTAFRSGQVVVVDVGENRIVRHLAVEDRDGRIGLCVTGDGRRVVIVDGNARSRLRVFDGFTAEVLDQVEFKGRKLTVDGPPVAALSADGGRVFVQCADSTRVYDLARRRFLPRPLPMRCSVLGGGAAILAVSGSAGLAFAPRGTAYALTERVPLGLSRLADAAALADGSRLIAAGPVPPMRTLPESASPLPGQARATPTPNPALREGPWTLVSWSPGQPPRRIDLVKKGDVEKVSSAGPGQLATSPDRKQVALVYARRAWILAPDSLAVRWEIYPPGVASGAGFTADSANLLTVLGHSLLSVHLADRRRRTLVRDQLPFQRAPTIVAGPRPDGPISR
jgi:hypothetical protein